VDKVFFAGYPASAAGKPVTIVYFAVPLEAKKGIAIKLFAKDTAGNESLVSVPYLLLAKKFRRDAMNLSDGFLQQKMPEFQAANPDMRGKTLLETFLYVNGVLREDNRKTIVSLCSKSAPRQLWQDTFVRMKNASPMALFGDHRTYLYGGKALGESVHMGVDLASTAQAPVEAVNSGVVVFAAGLGIYGNAVIIDHGIGLFSLYGHLSEISVKAGQSVKRNDPIGRSGTTGLAGGDHLHLSLLVGGEFVNPQEWWDPHWIQDNVTKKMADAF
jgi:murein DD-endopeptidase MepM/ murein hydrolase activator NlpD